MQPVWLFALAVILCMFFVVLVTVTVYNKDDQNADWSTTYTQSVFAYGMGFSLASVLILWALYDYLFWSDIQIITIFVGVRVIWALWILFDLFFRLPRSIRLVDRSTLEVKTLVKRYEIPLDHIKYVFKRFRSYYIIAKFSCYPLAFGIIRVWKRYGVEDTDSFIQNIKSCMKAIRKQ